MFSRSLVPADPAHSCVRPDTPTRRTPAGGRCVLTLLSAATVGLTLATPAAAAPAPISPAGGSLGASSAATPTQPSPGRDTAATSTSADGTEPEVPENVDGHAAIEATAPAGRGPLGAAAPRAPLALKGALDARPTYQGQTSCDPFSKPGTKALGQMLLSTYRTGSYGIARACSRGGQSEHKEGRAVDWMLNVNNSTQRAAADRFLRWLVAGQGANARRLGVQYAIWNRKIWRAYASERGWTAYTGPSPHTDHIHLSLTWDGAMKRTSWWTGSAVGTLDRGPCRVYAGQYAPIYTARQLRVCRTALPAAPASRYPVLVLGQRSDTIKVAQRRLGVTADGAFGNVTRNKLLGWQRTRVPRTGVLDKATWARLVPAGATPSTPKRVPSTVTTRYTPYKKVRLAGGSRGRAVTVLQGGLKVKATGVYDARTRSAVIALQGRWRLPRTGIVDLKTWNRVELTSFPWIGYRTTILRQGNRGPAVVALQRALRISADGAFGPATAAALRAVQKAYGLPTTGVTSVRTWLAVIDNGPR